MLETGDLPSCCKENRVPHTCFGLCVVKKGNEEANDIPYINHLAGTCKDFLNVINKCHEKGTFLKIGIR